MSSPPGLGLKIIETPKEEPDRRSCIYGYEQCNVLPVCFQSINDVLGSLMTHDIADSRG